MRTHRHPWRGLVLATLAALALPSPARADSMPVYDMLVMTSLAELVVETTEPVTAEGGVTYAATGTVTVTKVHKGDAEVGDVLQVRVPKVYSRYVWPGQPKTVQQADGTTKTYFPAAPKVIGAVLFLIPDPKGKGYTPLGSGIKLVTSKEVYAFDQMMNPGDYVLVPQEPEMGILLSTEPTSIIPAPYTIHDLRKDVAVCLGVIGDDTCSLMAGTTYFDPLTGKPLGTESKAPSYQWALPVDGEPCTYTIGDVTVDTKTKTVSSPDYVISFPGEAVSKVMADGTVAWKVARDDYVSHASRDEVIVAGDLVLAPTLGKLLALSLATGAVEWESPGPYWRPTIWGDQVACSTEGTLDPDTKRLLTVRKLTDGSKTFEVELPHDPYVDSLEVLGLFLAIHGEGYTRVVDTKGATIIDIPRESSLAELTVEGILLVTTEGVELFTFDGGTKWVNDALKAPFVPGAGTVAMPKSQLVVYSWGLISDSGVELVRIDLKTGTTVWTHYVEPKGVGHSKYWHKVYVALVQAELFVVSQGAYATFVEAVDIVSGVDKGRWDL